MAWPRGTPSWAWPGRRCHRGCARWPPGPPRRCRSPAAPGWSATLAGITLTGKRLGRHAEADGRAAAAVIEAGAAAIAARTLVPLPPAELPDKLYIAIDGTGVPMRAAETEGRPGKGDDGKARTREVKLCLRVHPDQGR